MKRPKNEKAAKSRKVSALQEHNPLLRRTETEEEATAWANVANLASQALVFWNAFIGLRSQTDVLDSAALARLTVIIRAVSWVESRHGTGAGKTAAVDPMQCANPRDSWWKELTNCAVAQDRFVRAPGLTPNYDACKLPAAAAAVASFPAAAAISKLSSPAAGHNDGGFIALMSYAWGVPFLIFKINKTAGDNAYQCRDLSRSRLVEGAVAYNGGGDPAYRAKVNAAIDMIGGLRALLEFESSRLLDPQKIIDFCEQEYLGNLGDCNRFVKAVSTDLNVTLFQPGDDADAIVQRMRAAAWTRLDDGLAAKKKADAGLYVIAGLKGADHTPPRDHGHVAVVVSGPIASGKYPTGYWGSLGGSPGRSKTLNFAWNTADRDNVEYYATDVSLAEALQTSEISARDTAASLVQEIVTRLGPSVPGSQSVFFPSGIELIHVKVEVGATKVEVKVAGPKAPTG